jgi:hypothetical protein
MRRTSFPVLAPDSSRGRGVRARLRAAPVATRHVAAFVRSMRPATQSNGLVAIGWIASAVGLGGPSGGNSVPELRHCPSRRSWVGTRRHLGDQISKLSLDRVGTLGGQLDADSPTESASHLERVEIEVLFENYWDDFTPVTDPTHIIRWAPQLPRGISVTHGSLPSTHRQDDGQPTAELCLTPRAR